MSRLAGYYEELGYPPSAWHIGAEHPKLEEYAVGLLRDMSGARVLEIGYQAGGFAVPVILAMRDVRGFAYVGVDSLAYGSAVDGGVIARYLEREGVTGSYEFVADDAGRFLSTYRGEPFDLVLIDHDKRCYPRDLRTVLRRGLVRATGRVLLHDVLAKAKRVAADCAALARRSGWTWTTVADIPEGLAVVAPPIAAPPLTAAEHAAVALAVARIRGRDAMAALRRWTRRAR